jgi:TRAP-type C4-dicarboxylate transport system substrate-binding protein
VAAIESFGKKLEAATNGRLSVRMYPSMQLGGEKETIEQTQIGAVQWLAVNAGALGPIVDDINVVNMPFLFRNIAHAEKMMDGPLGQECRSSMFEALWTCATAWPRTSCRGPAETDFRGTSEG